MMERDTGGKKGSRRENKPYTDVLQGSTFVSAEWRRSLISQVQFWITEAWEKDSHRD